MPWSRLLFQVLDLRIPSTLFPAHEEEWERGEWWKTKWGFWEDRSIGTVSILVFMLRVSDSPMEGELMSTTQVRQSLAASQPAARRIRRVYNDTICDSVCAQDLQSVSSIGRIIRLGTGVAPKSASTNFPIELLVLHSLITSQLGGAQGMGLVQTWRSNQIFTCATQYSSFMAHERRPKAFLGSRTQGVV